MTDTPEPPEPPGPSENTDAGWRRLDPRMLLVHPVQETIRFLPLLLIVFFTGRSGQRSPWWDAGALAAIVLFGLSRWFTTRYRVDRGQIELRRGLLRREVIATPAERVRTVDVTASVWHRLLGLAKVEVGTAGGHGVERLVLDALSAREAANLRVELLHRSAAAAGRPTAAAETPAPDTTDALGDAAPAPTPAPVPDPETVLLRLDPRWARFAPLTTSGLVSAAAILGFFAQFVDVLDGRDAQIGGAVRALQALGILVFLVVAVAAGLAFVTVLALTGYVLSYWGFRLTRHHGGTLHVSRGLLTSRATSIEESRMRGVEVGEPLGLRLAGGARLTAITTGLRRGDSPTGSAVLAPPAPRPVVAAVAAAVVDDPVALTGGLVQHGPAARRRRYVRAIGGTLLLAGGPAAVGVWWRWPVGIVGLLVLACLASPLLAKDRYAALGHLLTDRHLVARAGSFSRRRDVLARQGVIGVVVRESFFQRRAGVATLTATTAAGKQGYSVLDVPAYQAVELSLQLLPDTVGQFVGRGSM